MAGALDFGADRVVDPADRSNWMEGPFAIAVVLLLFYKSMSRLLVLFPVVCLLSYSFALFAGDLGNRPNGMVWIPGAPFRWAVMLV